VVDVSIATEGAFHVFDQMAFGVEGFALEQQAGNGRMEVEGDRFVMTAQYRFCGLFG
jgi:hypothetical protein